MHTRRNVKVIRDSRFGDRLDAWEGREGKGARDEGKAIYVTLIIELCN